VVCGSKNKKVQAVKVKGEVKPLKVDTPS